MATIKVLIEGYTKKLDNGWKASSTTYLITSNDNKSLQTLVVIVKHC